MRHFQALEPTTMLATDPLLEQVYSILDSRIQFIDYQVQRYFTNHTQTTPVTALCNDIYRGPAKNNRMLNDLDSILQFTGKLQDDLKLLQTLRTWLKGETVQVILDLLTDNKYLKYSEEHLEVLLRRQFNYEFEVC